jgi:membrane-associated phospholipid phosphatase
MQSLTEMKVRVGWGRFTLWVSHHQPITRLVGLTFGLVVFLMVLPRAMRIIVWDGLFSHPILASMLLVFNLLAISLIWSTGQNLDAWAFLFFNLRGSRPIWLDQVMLGFTQIGSGITALGIALVFYITNDHLLAYEIVLGTLTLWLEVELVKFLVHRSRPFIRVTQARVVGRRAIGRSFPSGHTSQAFFMATLMAQYSHFNIWAVFLLYATALVVGITRMYVGAHYPRDVLAGAILGSAWGLLGVIVSGYVLIGIG